MATEKFIGFAPKAVRQIAEVVRRVLRETQNDAAGGSRGPVAQRPVTCVLDAAITAPTNGLTGATTATASVLSRNSSGNLVDAGYNITVVNRMEGISLVQYTLCVATWVDGEWRITSADCDALGSWP